MWQFKDFTICVANLGCYFVYKSRVNIYELTPYLNKRGFDIDIYKCKKLTDLYFKDIEEIEKALSIYYDLSVVLDIPRIVKEIVQ